MGDAKDAVRVPRIILTVTALAFAGYQLYFERLSVYSIWFVAALANSANEVTAPAWDTS